MVTVAELFKGAVVRLGWPGRIRGDYGTENNEVERLIIEHWGDAHRAYLRGRQEFFFFHMNSNNCSDLDTTFALNDSGEMFARTRARDIPPNLGLSGEERAPGYGQYFHSMCLYLVFVNGTTTGCPPGGYWTGDAGDTRTEMNELYGVDGEGPAPQNDNDPTERMEQPTMPQAQREAGLIVNDDDELKLAATLLEGFDLNRDDGNWGIDVYCEAVVAMTTKLQSQ
ncbi:hypothetical protein C8R44DRAFT_746407 [Mycena epipterygia]|nr:hypothetical protein C8R44DRAFT_746407 [Mycena epipterygia]